MVDVTQGPDGAIYVSDDDAETPPPPMPVFPLSVEERRDLAVLLLGR